MKEEYYSRKIILEDVFNGSLTDHVTYPEDDLVASHNERGEWMFAHKDGTKYL